MTQGFDYRSGYYQRVCDLASGGMGTVTVECRRDGAFERLYAVKRLHPHLREDGEFRDMFVEEARIAGLVHHPNVVGVLDVGEDQNGPFLVMDYVDGVSLGTMLALALDRRERLPIDLCVEIARDIARGLGAAHELHDREGRPLRVVHRDVSPANVLVGFDGVARLTDFGIARALGRTTRTATGMIKGKFAYLSPEQLRFEEPDQRSDLFSLGIVFYEMLSGTRLYRGNDGARRILTEPPPDIADERPDAPTELVALLFDLLAKEPAHRPGSARDVELRLSFVLEAFPAGERVDVGRYVRELAAPVREQRHEQLRAGRMALARAPVHAVPAARRKARVGLGVAIAIVACALVGLAVFGLLGAGDAPADRERVRSRDRAVLVARPARAESEHRVAERTASSGASERDEPAAPPPAPALERTDRESRAAPARRRHRTPPGRVDDAPAPAGLKLRGWDGR